jgi:hypothetical protein
MNEPIIRVSKGEEIAMMCISGLLVGTGYYKFLAKKRIDKKYEWAHFVERLNKRKENFYRGEAKDLAELNMVFGIMNRTLIKTFGPLAEMKPAATDYYSEHGKMSPAND